MSVTARLLIAATVVLSIASGLGCIDVNVIQSGIGAGGGGGSPPQGEAGVGADAGTNQYDAPQDSSPSLTCMPNDPQGEAGSACLCDGDCLSGFCVENVCCNTACTGGCYTCAAPGLVGICTKLASGAAPRNASDCPAQDPSSCGLDGTCDGAGACRFFLGTRCLAGSCVGSAVVGSHLCDGSGHCSPGSPVLCTPYACDTTTNACLTACSPTAQCTGAQACDFTTGSCGLVGIGVTCAKGTDCQSGFCADSVCCSVACDGACVSCSIPGLLGTCWPIDAGKGDPRGVCKDQGALSCGHDGTCDGVGGCANYPQNTECLAPSCSGDRLNTPGSCDGLGTCDSGGVLNCGPFLCAPASNGAPAACTNTCKVDADCDPPAACTNGSCGPKPLGHICAASSECGSNQCVDGVCCDSACTGACRSCNLTSSPGHCTLVAAGTTKDPRGICTDKGAASCGNNGTCDGSGGCAHYAVGTVCAGETCANGVYTPPSTCSASGQCAAPDSLACTPYVCNGTACFNSCTSNDQCKTPNTCDASSSCGKSLGAFCIAAAECKTGVCAQGICCSSPCSGPCQSCALNNALGICTSVPAGLPDPQGICRDAGASSCGTNGKCDGQGNCQKYVQGTTCLDPSCPSGTTTFTPASTCDGAGTCVTPTSITCDPYLCGANACKSS
jgi:hypothetical protein